MDDEKMAESDRDGGSAPSSDLDSEPVEAHNKKESEPHFVSKCTGGYRGGYRGGPNRLFGRERPLHIVLGGGNTANIFLWRNKQISGGIFAGGTVIWFLFEYIGYHLITFICHSLILLLSGLFLWSNLAAFSNLSPPEFPDIKLPEEVIVKVALTMSNDLNWVCKSFQEIAFGKNIKKFLLVALVLWVVSVVGNWFNFLTLLFFMFVMMLTLPILYEKNEDVVDIYGAKVLVELKKHYDVVDELVLQKIPIASFQKKHQ